MMMTHNPPRIGFVSLGYPKALVDSERTLTQLRAEGYAVSDSYDNAEPVIINSCGFIDSAVDASGAVARSMADAPEIDGVAYLPEVTDIQPGEIVEADDLDLWGVPVP